MTTLGEVLVETATNVIVSELPTRLAYNCTLMLSCLNYCSLCMLASLAGSRLSTCARILKK